MAIPTGTPDLLPLGAPSGETPAIEDGAADEAAAPPPGDEDQEGSGGDLSPDAVAQVSAAGKLERQAAADEVNAVLAPGVFVVAIRVRSGWRTLHRYRHCFRVPGRDYLNYQVVGDLKPDAATYNKMCGDCFRKKSVPAFVAEASEASTGSSSSSAGSGDEMAGGSDALPEREGEDIA